MSWQDLVIALMIIAGIVLFLIGSNYYNDIVGWLGVGLILAGIVAEIIFEVNKAFGKKEKGVVAQKP